MQEDFLCIKINEPFSSVLRPAPEYIRTIQYIPRRCTILFTTLKLPGMNHPQRGVPDLYRPVLLTAELQKMQELLARAKNATASKQAAVAILEKFCSFFDPEHIRSDMQQMLHGCFCNPHLKYLNDADERLNSFFFYEFTLLMMDALHTLYGSKEK
jgi:hypothetical protein